MQLEFIDTELCESRLYRTTRNFTKFNGKDVADLLYLNTLAAFMMTKDTAQQEYATAYISKTTQYGNYTLFRTHATDLYLLAYHVSHPKNKTIDLADSLISDRFLEGLNFDYRDHWKFLREVITVSNESSGRATSFFYRLEQQLKISNPRFKQLRRLILDWANLKYIQQQMVVATLAHELRKKGIGSELLSPINTMLKYRDYRVSDETTDVPGLGTKLAGAAVGAAAGRAIGSKVATSLGKDEDKYKKVGTGIGAIAGYWAAGRRRQR
jgi:hypothetical protein